MAPLESGDLAILPRWRLARFWAGGVGLFWGAVFFGLSWLATDPNWQFGSWLTFANELPVPNRVLAMLAIAGLLTAMGIQEIGRALRSPLAVLGQQTVSFPRLFDWRRVAWNDVVRVSLDSGRYLTFEIVETGGRKSETIDLFLTRTSKDAVARKLGSVRPDLIASTPKPGMPDPFRQEGDFGHHIWP